MSGRARFGTSLIPGFDIQNPVFGISCPTGHMGSIAHYCSTRAIRFGYSLPWYFAVHVPSLLSLPDRAYMANTTYFTDITRGGPFLVSYQVKYLTSCPLG